MIIKKLLTPFTKIFLWLPPFIYLPTYTTLWSLIIPLLCCSKFSRRCSAILPEVWAFCMFYFMKMLFIKDITLHYNPKILEYKKTIVISNHVNNIDWFVIWISLLMLKKKGFIFHAKKNLFVFGRLLSGLNKSTRFVFLRRKIDYDYITLVESCNNIKIMPTFHTVIFPEGTLYHKKCSPLVNIKRSFTRNVPATKNVLIPKTTGFGILVNQLKNDIDGIMNCTLKYTGKVTLTNLLKLQRISVDIYIDSESVPEENTSDWLINKFKEKESYFTDPMKIDNKKFLSIVVNLTTKIQYAIYSFCADKPLFLNT